ncbi:MAG: transglutaminase domain-containing protein [Actinobacteria bacterium]|nr:transglutaminase domain-containing protein [Actinomycetota bacterium]
MPGKLLSRLKDLVAPRDVDDSRGFRIAVWASVSVSVLALAWQGVINPSLVVPCLALIALGFLVSWWRRYNHNIPIKALIALLVLAACASFLRQSYLQPYDLRIPLAELFLWVQVLHSFDLPRRRDLLYSLVSSFILLALAGSYSVTTAFAWIVLIWLLCAVPALYHAQRSRLISLSAGTGRAAVARGTYRRVSATLSALLVAVTVASLAFGAFLPRFSVTYLRSLPFSLRRSVFSPQGYSLSNPGYPDLPSRPPRDPLEVNPEAYFGFGPFLDLRSRGVMSDLPVMKVRASDPAYWSGLVFRRYNGFAWELPQGEPERLYTPEQPFTITMTEGQSHLATKNLVQTYYLESEQPNVIFAAYRPALLYYPSDYIYRDESGLKSPFTLSQGLVYSAVSYCIEYSDDELLPMAGRVREGEMAPYLELPELPERVRRLAEEIAPREGNVLVKARAIEDYLARNYEYSLDVPPLPPGKDAVDFFLFETRRGYCEHFATAYAVLCRLAGVPSRVVTGYSTGEYNPFTGLYEVSLDDAHAWAEIYLPGVGWVAREPTPGFALPDYRQSYGIFWIFRDLFSWLGRGIASLFPPSLRAFFKSAFSALASGVKGLFSGLAYSSREAPWLPATFFLLLVAAAFAVRARARRRSAHALALAGDPIAAMEAFLRSLEPLGIARVPQQTLWEYRERVASALPGISLEEEFRLFERARYGGGRLDPAELSFLKRGLARAVEEAGLLHGKGGFRKARDRCSPAQARGTDAR